MLAEEKKLRVDLALANQRSSAARHLWGAESRAEALRLMASAAQATLEVVLETHDAASAHHEAREVRSEADMLRALGWLGVTRAMAHTLVAAERAVSVGPLPVLDRDLVSRHMRLYRDLDRGTRAATAKLEGKLRTRGQRALRITVMVVAPLLLLAAIGAAALVAWHRAGRRISPSASASLDYMHNPGRAVDSDANTEWALPNRTEGTLDLAFSRPRALASVHVLNGVGFGFETRAVDEYKIELFRGSLLLTTITGRMDGSEDPPSWIEHAVPLVGEADRLRFHVLSHRGLGGALSEIAVRDR